MARYVTTNVRFPEATYRELQHQSGRRRVPLASLVREAVDRYLGRAEDAGRLPFGEDPVDGLVGCVETSGGDESINHDHYLYGWPKETASEAPGGHERAAGPGLPRRPEPRRGRGVRAGKRPRPVPPDRADPR